MFCQLQSKGRMSVEGRLADKQYNGLTDEEVDKYEEILGDNSPIMKKLGAMEENGNSTDGSGGGENDNSGPTADSQQNEGSGGGENDNSGAGSDSDSESDDDDSVTSGGTSKGGNTASIGPTGFNDLVKELAVRPDLLNIPAFREKLASGLGEVVGERWSTWPHIMQLMVDDAVSFLDRDVRMSESFVQAYKAAGRK